MADIRKKLTLLWKRPFYRYGVPFIVFVVGGSFGLKQFSQLRYDFSKQCPVTPELAEKHGVKMKKPGEVTLESEYEKVQKLDIDNWTNVRGPRPWEEDTLSNQAKSVS
ncbi:hypothetical protein C0J52_12563 [Blattella germanica]|nr:hypothetical protein C0J52_12563 [Blattella germanica]